MGASKPVKEWRPDWYDQRIALCKYTISASIAVVSLLVLSRDKLPAGPLASNWLYFRLSLIAACIAAVTSFFVWIFTYRERFFYPAFLGREHWRLYGWVVRNINRRVETCLLWGALTIGPVAFTLAMASAAVLVLRCLWIDPPK
jgi:hypothetical protein